MRFMKSANGTCPGARNEPTFPRIFIMSKVNVKQYYSTRRKRDLVTGGAIIMFGVLIVFQLYITIVFPLQLNHQHLLIAEMEKDEMYEQIDRIRETVRRNKGKTCSFKSGFRVMSRFAIASALSIPAVSVVAMI